MVDSRSHFNVKTLNKLLATPHSCVSLRKCERHIALSPNALNHIKDSIRAHLNRLVTKFDSELQAVVLGCRNINVLTNVGTILDDAPHVHLDIEAEFYLFRPEEGSILSGVINKISNDNIGCLVHDIFNASIPLDVDDQEDSFNIENFSIGEPLTFQVTVIDFSESLPYIRGRLLNSQLNSPEKSRGKKRKRNDEDAVHKRIKTEIESSISPEEFHLDHLEITPTRLPTSILKKNFTRDTNSPLRRISFYGDDCPQTPNVEGKQKKKKKKCSEDSSMAETSITSRKKKHSQSVSENELQESGVVEDNDQINLTAVKLKKKKKTKIDESKQKAEISNNEENGIGNEDYTNIQQQRKKKERVDNFSSELDKSYETPVEASDYETVKTKKRKKKETVVSEEHEVAGAEDLGDNNQNDIYDNPLEKSNYETVKTKKRKKREVVTSEHEVAKVRELRDNNQSANDHEKKNKHTSQSEYEQPEMTELTQSNEMFQSPTTKKKKKKKKESGMYEQETEKSPKEQYDETVRRNNEKKKQNITSVLENKIFKTEGKEYVLSDEFKKSIPENLKRQKKKKDKVIEKHNSSVPHDHVNADNSSENTSKRKKLKNEKNKAVDLNKTKGTKVSEDPSSSSHAVKVYEHSLNIQSEASSAGSKTKSIANSTIKTKYELLKEKRGQNLSSDSFESFSPIKETDNSLKSKEHFKCNSSHTSANKKHVPSDVQSAVDDTFRSISPISNEDSDNEHFGFITSTQVETRPNMKQITSDVQRVNVTASKSPKKMADASSDTDDNSSIDYSLPKTVSALKHTLNDLKSNALGTSPILKSPGSDSSSSDSDSAQRSSSDSDSDSAQHSAQSRLQNSYEKTKEMQSPKTMDSISVETESECEMNLPLTQNKEKLVSNIEEKLHLASRDDSNISDADGSTDSDLPSHMSGRKIMLSSVSTESKDETNRKTKIISGASRTSEDLLLPLPSDSLQRRKSKSSPGTKVSSVAAKQSRKGNSDNDDLESLPLLKSHAQETQSNVENVSQEKPLSPSIKLLKSRNSCESALPSTLHDTDSTIKLKQMTSKKLKQTKHQRESENNLKGNSAGSLEKLLPVMWRNILQKKSLSTSLKPSDPDSSSSDSDLPSGFHNKVEKQKFESKNLKDIASGSAVKMELVAEKNIISKKTPSTLMKTASSGNSDSYNSNSDVPSGIHNRIAQGKKTSKKLKKSKRKSEPNKNSKDSKISRVVKMELDAEKSNLVEKPSTHIQTQDSISSSDLDLPSGIQGKVSLSTEKKKTPHKLQSPRKKSSSTSVVKMDLGVEENIPMKKSSVLSQNPGSNVSSSDSDLPSDLRSKFPLSQKKESSIILKQPKKESHAGKQNSVDKPTGAEKYVAVKKLPVSHEPIAANSGRSDLELPSNVHNKVQSMNKKKKAASELKQTEKQVQLNEGKISESDPESIIEGLLQRVKSEVKKSVNLTASLSRHNNVKETNKKNIKLKDKPLSVVQTGGTIEKVNSAQETNKIEKTDMKSVNSQRKGKTKLTPEELSALANELLGNLL